MTKGLFKRIKAGAEALTPLQQLRAKRVGTWGQLIGLLLGIGLLMWNGYWSWLPFLAFTFFVMIIELIGVHQQVRRIEQVMEGHNGF